MGFSDRRVHLFLSAVVFLAAGLFIPTAKVTAAGDTTVPSFQSDSPPPPEPATSRPSYLTILPMPEYPVGQRIQVDIQLVNSTGVGLPNKPIILYINGERVRRDRTDDDGTVSINIGKTLPVGEYYLEAVFIGTEAYSRSKATATFKVRPLELTIETLPLLPGMRFAIGGQVVEAAADGLARMEINKPGTYLLKVILPSQNKAQTDTLIAFDRWGDSVFTAEREVDAIKDIHLQAGFALSHRVSQRFIDLNGNDVASNRIDSLTIKSSFGSLHRYEDNAPHWLQANRIARRANGLEVTSVQYSVESVMIDGTNVVNRYQQRFFLEPEDTWTIELLLYFARVTTKDALFGFSLGEGITVAFPNGRNETHLFGPEDEIHLGPLARGTYLLQVAGAKGITPPTPVALSRDQVVTLKVFSALDIGLVVFLGIFGGLGLLMVGRPQLLNLTKELVVTNGRSSWNYFSRQAAKLTLSNLTAIPTIRFPHNGFFLREKRLLDRTPVGSGWHAYFRTNGAHAVERLDRQKRRWKVTPAYLMLLDETLAHTPKAYGYGFKIWTRERLRDHLERRTKLRISVNWLGILLKERGYIYQRPQTTARNG